MTYLQDAHAEWHTVHGWNVCCPLDCGAGEPDLQEQIAAYEEHEAYWDSLMANEPPEDETSYKGPTDGWVRNG